MSKEVAVKKDNMKLAAQDGHVTFLDEPEFQADAGKGISKSAADKQVPLMRVLQSLSPQVKRNNPAYIEGAEEGMILLRGAPNPLATEVIFQPCCFSKHVVEWVTREQGGGFVARYAYLSPDETPAALAQRLGARPDRENKFKFVLPNGHELIETRYQIGQAILGADLVIPFVIPFSGSGHTIIRHWEQQLDIDGRRRSAFGSLWKLTTRSQRNAKGDWFVLNPTSMGRLDTAQLPFPVDETLDDEGHPRWRKGLYLAGKALYESIERGEREIAPDEVSAEDLGDQDRRAAI